MRDQGQGVLAWWALEGWHDGELLGDNLEAERRFVVKTEPGGQSYR